MQHGHSWNAESSYSLRCWKNPLVLSNPENLLSCSNDPLTGSYFRRIESSPYPHFLRIYDAFKNCPSIYT
jgi:hypothetical protein